MSDDRSEWNESMWFLGRTEDKGSDRSRIPFTVEDDFGCHTKLRCQDQDSKREFSSDILLSLPMGGPSGTDSTLSTADTSSLSGSVSNGGLSDENSAPSSTAPEVDIQQHRSAGVKSDEQHAVAPTAQSLVSAHIPSVTNTSKNTSPDTPNIPSLEPIAIVGMAFKYPAGAETENSFWELLMSKTCASSEFPADRMNVDAFYSAQEGKPHTMNTRNAHFLTEDIRGFDAKHFGIPAVEAGSLDPNQRGLMETAYHALENAGISSSAISGSDTSVHIGFFTTDFSTFELRDHQDIPKYYGTGSSPAILSNRLSWYFNLRGPSMTIDTACSSSLIALDLACQGLWSGTSRMALVGSANLILSPEWNIALTNMNFLSRDGRCYSFDHRASGYARGEGFTVLVLKPLSQALAAGDHIRALIRSVASNQDGHTNGGITQPSRELQSKLIRETYARAGLSMSETRYFEAHGTGTLIGDSTEARAIGETFRRYRTDINPLYVGAVKSNVGHLEGASGLVSIVKAVLAIKHGVIPPNANFEKLNPAIDDEFYRIVFPQEAIPWPKGSVRRASVNSFGFGGSNAHVVLDDLDSFLLSRGQSTSTSANYHSYAREDPRLMEAQTAGQPKGEPYDIEAGEHSPVQFPRLFVLSASDEAGIARQVRSHSYHLQTFKDSSLQHILPSYAYTLGCRRALLPWRSYGVLNPSTGVYPLVNIMSAPIHAPVTAPNLGLIFTGQGAQWYGMGRQLLSEPVFYGSIQRSQSYLLDLGCSWTILEYLTEPRNSEHVDVAQFSQVLSTSIQIALVDLVNWLGIKFTVVVGHSSGEIAAAYAAGLLSHAAGISICYHRGILASELARTSSIKWSMAAVGLSYEDAASEISMFKQDYEGEDPSEILMISCENSPINVTISGPESHLRDFIERLQKKNIFGRQLKVGLGYHSSQMCSIKAEYIRRLSDIDPNSWHATPRSLMVSSLTGEVVDASTIQTADYWVDNMVSPVNFLGAIRTCDKASSDSAEIRRLDLGHVREVRADAWLEIGPHAALRGPIREILTRESKDRQIIYTSALIRNRCAITSVLAAVGELMCRSVPMDVSRVVQLGLSTRQRAQLRVLSDLPKYQFDRSTLYWEEPQMNKDFRFRKFADHDLLGTRLGEADMLEAQWRYRINPDEKPWVVDHKVSGVVLYPAAGMIVMAIEAVKQLHADSLPDALELIDISFPAPIVLGRNTEPTEVHIHLSSLTRGEKGEIDHKFRIFVREVDSGQEVVCQGTIRPLYQRSMPNVVTSDGSQRNKHHLQSTIRTALKTCNRPWKFEQTYQTILDQTGIEYGPAFQVIDNVRLDSSGSAIAELLPRAGDYTTSHTVHPTRLDGIFQLAFAAINAANPDLAKAMIPTFVSRMWIASDGFGHETSSQDMALAQVQDINERTANFDFTVVNGADVALRAKIRGLEVTAVKSQSEPRPQISQAPYLLGYLDWKVDFDTLTNEEIQKYCEEARLSTPEPIQHFHDLETLMANYGRRALSRINQNKEVVAPHIAKYIAWLRLTTESMECTFWQDGEDLHMLRTKVERTATGELSVRIGEELIHYLTGEEDPLHGIFADQSRVTAFYQEVMMNTTGVAPFARYLDTLVHKRPDMKFLEVGAGTGSSTSVVLAVIGNAEGDRRYERYTFTDLSPAFFKDAKDRFSKYGGIDCQVLNVEHDPAAQGFEPGSYNVVVADNVLHATHDIKATLQNIRSLLCPGGILILKELITRRLSTGFVFGLLPGWWLAKEPERELSPVLNEQQWDAYLRAAGFSGVDFAIPDNLAPEARFWSIMISTVKADHPPCSEPVQRVQSEPFFVLDTSSSDTHRRFGFDVSRALSLCSQPTFLTLAEASQLCEFESHKHSFIFLNELQESSLGQIQSEHFSYLQRVLAYARSVLWVKGGAKQDAYSDPDFGISDGLCRVARRENLNVLVSVCIEVPNDTAAVNVAKAYYLAHGDQSRNRFGPEQEYQEIGGRLCVSRIVNAQDLNEHCFRRTRRPLEVQKIGDRNLKISIRAPGLLDTMEFVEDTLPSSLSHDEIEVEVRAFGINYNDCLRLLGKFNSDFLGSECSGVVRATGRDVVDIKIGDRVMVGAHDVFRTYARVPRQLVVKIPDTLSFAEAASLPTNFATAYYSIVKIARLSQGNSILIHSAAGGTGQAMVQLAMHIGAVVYATVGSMAKKELLVKQYDIPASHIFYSRDDSFADNVRHATGDRGVDVIINTAQGRLLEASLSCIAMNGRFIDIGLKDAYLRNQLPMHVFTKNVSFTGVNLFSLLLHNHEIVREMHEGIMDLVVERSVKTSTPLQIYPLDRIVDACRLLQSGKSEGKLVVEVNRGLSVPVVQGSNSSYQFFSNATYIVAGGLGGIGRNVARWLVERGARHLIIISRSSGNKRAKQTLDKLATIGAKIKCLSCDLADLASLQALLQECKENMPPIRGCVQAAMVLRDSKLSDMSFDDWNAAVRPKVQGSWNLHIALPADLDFFIFLSSCAGIIGHAGQANYCAGNTYQDALARYRCSLGQKSVSIDVGAVMDSGFLADNEEIRDRLIQMNIFRPGSIAELLSILDYYCDPLTPAAEPSRAQVVSGLPVPSDLRAKGFDVPSVLEQPLFLCLHQVIAADQSPIMPALDSVTFEASFRQADSSEAASLLVSEALRSKLSRILGLAEDSLTLDSALDSYGVDSLVGLELRNWLARETKADLAVFEILGGATLRDIGKTVTLKSTMRPEA